MLNFRSKRHRILIALLASFCLGFLLGGELQPVADAPELNAKNPGDLAVISLPVARKERQRQQLPSASPSFSADAPVPSAAKRFAPGWETTNETIVVAFCGFDQRYRLDYPNKEAKWFAMQMANSFQKLGLRVQLDECVPDEEYMTWLRKKRNKTYPLMELGFERALGLHADFRVCFFGTTSIVRSLMKLENAVLLKADFGKARFLSEHRFVAVPEHFQYVGKEETKEKVGPILVRHSGEPWLQSVRGIDIQLDSKRDLKHLSPAAMSVFYPHMLMSTGRRTLDTAVNKWTFYHGCCAEGEILDLAKRTGYFDAKSERLKKRYFASFLQSHCHTYLHSTAIRNAFVYELSQKVRPVNPLGVCPRHKNSTALVGLTSDERRRRASRYQRTTSIGAHHEHKFTVSFENTFVEGYLSEKLLEAYIAASLPIYFGSDKFTEEQMLNQKAYVQCYLPENLVEDERLEKLFNAMCPKNGMARSAMRDCEHRFDLEIQKEFGSHFEACINRVNSILKDDKLYEQMLREPLHAADISKTAWNTTFVAETLLNIRDAILHIHQVKEDDLIDNLTRKLVHR